MGEHNIFFEHQFHVFEETTRVPLLIRLPGASTSQQPAMPRRVKSLCSPMDLMSTILDYINISFDRKVDGQSLLPVLSGAEESPRFMFIEFPNHCHPMPTLDFHGLRTDTHKLIRTSDPETHTLIAQDVYEIIADPLEQRPIPYKKELLLHRELSNQMDVMLEQARRYEIPFTLTFYRFPHSKREKFVEQRKKAPKKRIKKFSEEQIKRLRGLGYVQ
jgi:arylsulfatase A-like enzyme